MEEGDEIRRRLLDNRVLLAPRFSNPIDSWIIEGVHLFELVDDGIEVAETFLRSFGALLFERSIAPDKLFLLWQRLEEKGRG